MEPLYELVKVTSNKLNRERHSENKSGNMEWHVQINGGHIFNTLITNSKDVKLVCSQKGNTTFVVKKKILMESLSKIKKVLLADQN